jgi:hypothetical protein
VKLHITGMGTSYILLLTAFYVDNGKSLPLWRDLSPVAYWLAPAVVGVPLIVRALLWHPLARTPLRLPRLIDYKEPVLVDWTDSTLIH